MHSDLENSPIVTERLRELPTELSPPISWLEFQRRARERMAESPPRPWQYAAMAAGFAAFIAGIGMWGRVNGPNRETNAVPTQVAMSTFAMPDQQQAIAQAKASERWLADLPAEPNVVRVGTRSAVADLEDRIAWMDDVLSDEGLDAVNLDHLAALRQERARMVNSLAQVRYAETLASNVP